MQEISAKPSANQLLSPRVVIKKAESKRELLNGKGKNMWSKQNFPLSSRNHENNQLLHTEPDQSEKSVATMKVGRAGVSNSSKRPRQLSP